MSETPEEFMQYFRTNYPGPTIIASPDWHAPKIYRAAIIASAYIELREALEQSLTGLLVIKRQRPVDPSWSKEQRQAMGELDRLIVKSQNALAKARGESKEQV